MPISALLSYKKMTKPESDPPDDLTARCKAAGLDIRYEEPEEYGMASGHIIFDPAEPDEWTVAIISPIEEEILLKSEFEKYRPTPGYDGMWSKSNRTIECELVCKSPILTGDNELTSLAYACHLPRDSFNNPGFRFEIPTPQGGPTVSIGWSSAELLIWRGASPSIHLISQTARTPSIRIGGVSVATKQDARKLLEQYGASALLELDVQGFVSRLRTHQPWEFRFTTDKPRQLQTITTTPSIEAANLYWQGRFSDGISATFICYYQVLEYFFPKFSPQPNPPPKNKPKEVVMLENTIRSIISNDELRSLLESDSHLKSYYLKTTQDISPESIPLANTNSNLINSSAKRIYSIRCMLVHKKSGHGGSVLLPLSPEVSKLKNDTRLVKKLAQICLRKTSTPLPF
ncbi:hypothetical protein OV208_12425 [Corallococcus sp. bb12-1]|uniref:hypothetical protein n=1 Tax=Corallococcus sp. bb12-1 TaxID=2996784 RepID=UPI00226F0177|nr:hypothetical protein [Corallococcus sp. bb12-1]MCY1042122.1 hypothetical protein [Corallococcus sp. bb12-1]